MTIYQHREYKAALRAEIEAMPKKGWGVITRLAEEIGMNQSHLSQVISGDRDLSLEQAFKVCGFFSWGPREVEYFLTLVQYARAGTHDLQAFYAAKIESLAKEGMRIGRMASEHRVLDEESQALFYSSWVYSAVRMLSSIEGGATTSEIAARLQLSRDEQEKVTEFLLSRGLCKRVGSQLHIGDNRTFIEKGSAHFVRHTMNWRMRSIEKSQFTKESDLFITSPMSLSQADWLAIKTELLELLKKVNDRVKDSRAEEAVCLNIDLFKI